MKIILVSKCSLDIEQYVEFKMSVLISESCMHNKPFLKYVGHRKRVCFSLGNELSKHKITQAEVPPLLLCPPYFKMAYDVLQAYGVSS